MQDILLYYLKNFSSLSLDALAYAELLEKNHLSYRNCLRFCQKILIDPYNHHSVSPKPDERFTLALTLNCPIVYLVY